MTSMFGQPIARLEDDRLLRGNGAYLDDLGHDALAAAFVRSPHAHARVLDIDVGAALDVDGLVAIYTYEDLQGRLAEPLPLLIPHPALTHGRTGTWPRTRPSGSLSTTSRCPQWSAWTLRGPPSTWSTPTCPAMSPRIWCRTMATPPPR